MLLVKTYYILYLLRLSNKPSFDILSSILFDKVLSSKASSDKALSGISNIILSSTIISPSSQELLESLLILILRLRRFYIASNMLRLEYRVIN